MPAEEALDRLLQVFRAKHTLEFVCYSCGEYICGWGYCHNAQCDDSSALIQCNCWVRGPYSIRKHEGTLADAKSLRNRAFNPAGLTIVENDAAVELVRDLVLDLKLLLGVGRLEQPFLRGKRSAAQGAASNVLRFRPTSGPTEFSFSEPEPGSVLKPAPGWLSRPDTPEEEIVDEDTAQTECDGCGEVLCREGHCHLLGCVSAFSPRACQCWHDGFLESHDVDFLAGLKAGGPEAALDAPAAVQLTDLVDRLMGRYSGLQSQLVF